MTYIFSNYGLFIIFVDTVNTLLAREFNEAVIYIRTDYFPGAFGLL